MHKELFSFRPCLAPTGKDKIPIQVFVLIYYLNKINMIAAQNIICDIAQIRIRRISIHPIYKFPAWCHRLLMPPYPIFETGIKFVPHVFHCIWLYVQPSTYPLMNRALDRALGALAAEQLAQMLICRGIKFCKIQSNYQY